MRQLSKSSKSRKRFTSHKRINSDFELAKIDKELNKLRHSKTKNTETSSHTKDEPVEQQHVFHNQDFKAIFPHAANKFQQKVKLE